MDKNMILKSGIEVLELNDGSEIEMTLNFRKLLEVRAKKKEVYNKYNKIMMDGPKEVFDNVTVLYMGYLCAQDDLENVMSEDEFIDKLPPYINPINQAAYNLISPKKSEASEEHSEAKSTDEEE